MPGARRQAGRRGVLVAALLWLASAAASAQGAASGLDFQPCELRGSGGQGRAPAECAHLDVAENRDLPEGRHLSLFVARLKALAPQPRADAVTLINGGPGASSVSMYVDLQGALAALNRERDIVILDQRGTGRSAPLDCPELESASQEFDPAEIRRASADCLADLDADPRQYTTSVAVEDLEALRLVLGYQRWDVYGVSYGTRVAQHYLQRYPDSVRTLIIDGVVPLDHALGPDIALNAQATLDSILARCASADYCAAAYPDLEDELATLSRQLTETPVELSIPHPTTGQTETVTLRYAHLAMTLRLLSYAPETAALIPLIIDQAARRRNYVPLASQALRIEQELGDAISFGMHNSVVCTEDVPFYGDLGAELALMESVYLGADQVRALQTICEVWPRGVFDPGLRTPEPLSTPVLLLSGERDPITPPAYAERAARLYPNNRNLRAPGQGHGVIGRGCVPQLVADFIDSADPTTLDATCLERLTDDAFFVDLLGPPP